MTDYATKFRKKALELLYESDAKHAAYGLAYKNKEFIEPFGIREEVAEDENEIRLFFSDEDFNSWSDELIKLYNEHNIEIYSIYAVHSKEKYEKIWK